MRLFRYHLWSCKGVQWRLLPLWSKALVIISLCGLYHHHALGQQSPLAPASTDRPPDNLHLPATHPPSVLTLSLPNIHPTNHLSQHSISLWRISSQKQLFAIEERLVTQLSKHPYHPTSHYHLALYYALLFEHAPHTKSNMFMQEMQWIQKAFQLSRQTILLHPHSPLGYIALAYAHGVSGDYRQAYMILSELSRQSSHLPPESYDLATRIIATKAHQHPGFVAHYLSSLWQNPQISPALFHHLITPLVQAQVDVHFVFQQLSPAQQKQPHVRDKVAIYYTSRASYAQHQNSPHSMLQHAHLAHQHGAHNLRLYLMLTEGWLSSSPQQSARYLQQAHDYVAAISAAPQHHSHHPHHLPVSHHDQAKLYWLDAMSKLRWHQTFDSNSLKTSLSFFVKQDPHQAEQHLTEIMALTPQAHKEQLLQFFYHIKNTYPTLRRIHTLLADLQMQLLNTKQAVAHIEDAIALDEDSAHLHAKLGMAFYALNNVTAASQSFYMARQLDPENASHHYNVACMEALLGQPERALDSLEHALKLNPRLQQKAANDHDLLSLHHVPKFQHILQQHLPSPHSSPSTAASPSPQNSSQSTQ